MTTQTIATAKVGHHYRIVQVNLIGAFRKRMLEMGLIKGETVEIVKYAPLGDPIAIKIKGYHLSLRKKEAHSIVVEDISHAPS